FRPMVISSICTVISFFIYDLCRVKMGGPGIAIAAVICFWFIFLLTLVDYIRRYGQNEDFRIRAFIVTTVKALVAVVAGILLVSLLFRFALLPLSPDKKIDAALLIGIMGFIYIIIVFALSLVMGGEEAKILKDLFARISRLVGLRK
ncbi:MAG TPA: hypothetical protein VK186_00505, partial [Candidatus Deferrimicrobium sp.]|nr:hypothetical protein [Candidatus Deferrimicrobium sp.]